MEKTLILLHTTEEGSLPRAAVETISAAKSLGGPFSVGIVGAGAAIAAASIGGCGADKFYCVDGPEYGSSRYSTDAAAAEAVARADGASLILAPGTMRWNRALPGLAARLGGAVETHATGISGTDGKLSLRRWFYRQRIEGELSRTQRPWVVLIEPGSYPSEPVGASPVQVEAVPVSMPSPCRTEVVGYVSAVAGEQTIRPDADLLFVTGAGWTKKQQDGTPHVAEAAELILSFVRKSQCSLGSSKSLVDLSGEGEAVLPFLTHLHQVGQTGSTPRHRKGLATCCHGEEPHVVGWRFVPERRAVNLDPNCGWARGKADVLYVADAFAVMRAVQGLLDAS